MAVNDIVTIVPTQVANNASLALRPDAGAEWLIKNLYYSGAVEIYRTDGTNSIKIDSDGAAGGRFSASFLLTNASYLAIKNVSGADIYVAYDGLVTK
ncbi:MAG: hypothetical protein N2491_09700 [Negativicutes bacterium]|nr:hypothetical protein [Negativicutes bacterium]